MIGQEPPSTRIHADYKQQPGNPRTCVVCGSIHDTIVEDTRTGERLEEIDKCHDCLMSGFNFKWQTDQVELKSEWGDTLRCMTSDGRNVNIAEELMKGEF